MTLSTSMSHVRFQKKNSLLDKVKSLQTHSKNHTSTCRKGGKACRFNFPRPVSTRTFIVKPIPAPEGTTDATWRKEASEKMEVYWQTLEEMIEEDLETTTAQDILDKANLTQDELEHNLGRLAKKVMIILQREPNACWVNQYNPHLMTAWNANMDIQYVVDAYSCIAYILSYISKKESEETQLLKTAQKEAREGNTDAIAELRKIGRVYLSHREVSIMESIWRALGFPLKGCSRDVKWIPADDEASRYFFIFNYLF